MIIKRTLFLTLVCASLFATGANAAGQTLLVLGDSISAAYGMPVERGWVALLEERLAKTHPDVTVVNASISGETTDGGLRRLPELLTRYQPNVVAVELGANDGLRGHPIAKFRSNLTRIVKLAQGSGARVVLLQMEIPPNYGTRYTDAFHATYKTVARTTGSALSGFILEEVAGNPELTQADGIHPKSEAQARILDNILPTLLTALERQGP